MSGSVNFYGVNSFEAEPIQEHPPKGGLPRAYSRVLHVTDDDGKAWRFTMFADSREKLTMMPRMETWPEAVEAMTGEKIMPPFGVVPEVVI